VAKVDETWQDAERRMRELGDLRRVVGLLSWDQETLMPPAGAAARARRLATVQGIAHERLCDPAFGAALDRLAEAELDPVRAACVRHARRDRERARKLPTDFVRRLAAARSRGVQAWKRARAENDFAVLRGPLEQVVALTRERADRLSEDGEHYDALLDDYELGMRVERLEPLLCELGAALRELLDAVREPAAAAPPPPFAGAEFPRDAQWSYTIELLRELGFDLDAGRQDRSPHPFTSSPALADVRLTTRLFPDNPFSGIFSTIHEAGHGLYEQGFDPAHEDLPVADAPSLGLHESQSRLWENVVGRSLPFWQHELPRLRAAFPEQLATASVEDVHRHVNRVTPSLIRVDADEVTYNLHIIARFELELALVRGDLEVGALPDAWDDAYRRLLGIDPPDHLRGVLQDIHWSQGLIGYFPTYTLGNLYAAVLWGQLRRDRPAIEDEIERGEFAPLLGWLRERIHRHGRVLDGEELIRRVTGRPLETGPFVDYLWGKFGPLYGVARP
jgi:carboxypeptidase Taq